MFTSIVVILIHEVLPGTDLIKCEAKAGLIPSTFQVTCGVWSDLRCHWSYRVILFLDIISFYNFIYFNTENFCCVFCRSSLNWICTIWFRGGTIPRGNCIRVEVFRMAISIGWQFSGLLFSGTHFSGWHFFLEPYY